MLIEFLALWYMIPVLVSGALVSTFIVRNKDCRVDGESFKEIAFFTFCPIVNLVGTLMVSVLLTSGGVVGLISYIRRKQC